MNTETDTITYRVWVEFMGWMATVWTTSTKKEFEEWSNKYNFIKGKDGVYKGEPNHKGKIPYIEFKDTNIL